MSLACPWVRRGRNWLRSDHSYLSTWHHIGPSNIDISWAKGITVNDWRVCCWLFDVGKGMVRLAFLRKYCSWSMLRKEPDRKFSSSEECPGAIPDTVNNAEYLRDIYFKANPKYEGRFTVPVLWDKKLNTIGKWLLRPIHAFFLWILM